MRRISPIVLMTLGLGILAGCTAEAGEAEVSTRKVEAGKEDTSAEAVFVDFTFDGEFITDQSWGVEQQIEDQLLYTIGQLNGSRGVGRLDQITLSDVTTDSEDSLFRIRYSAVMPVAWGRRSDVPTEYTLQFPSDMRSASLDAFAENYGHDCVESGAHDIDAGSMWYYYRPANGRCNLAADDVNPTLAGVTPSSIQTTGRFPEYDRVWEDATLRVVAVFGKYEDGANTSSDAGISAYNSFAGAISEMFEDADTQPASIPRSPGVDEPELVWNVILPDGRRVEVVSLLVDNVRTAPASFDARYGELSSNADLIFYNGHAGLGSNIRALARKGEWEQGQYAIVFMNGCDTYAYVDSALWDAHAAVNPDDPEGTLYLDIVSNALPSYFRSMPRATLALIDGLLGYDEPKTYEQIFADIDSHQVVLVSGEQDNTFTPGGNVGGGVDWDGMTESGSLSSAETVAFETPVLVAGRYTFEMSGAGDADLYVRIGDAPTLENFDCRPYRSDSNETCEVELPADAQVFVMVNGYAQSSSFELIANKL